MISKEYKLKNKERNRLLNTLNSISQTFGKLAEDIGHSPPDKNGNYGIDLDKPWFNNPTVFKNNK